MNIILINLHFFAFYFDPVFTVNSCFISGYYGKLVHLYYFFYLEFFYVNISIQYSNLLLAQKSRRKLKSRTKKLPFNYDFTVVPVIDITFTVNCSENVKEYRWNERKLGFVKVWYYIVDILFGARIYFQQYYHRVDVIWKKICIKDNEIFRWNHLKYLLSKAPFKNKKLYIRYEIWKPFSFLGFFC